MRRCRRGQTGETEGESEGDRLAGVTQSEDEW